MNIKDSRVRGEGVDLAVRDWGGSGLPILLLPGAGQTLADLAPMAALLSARHRMVGMDWRGHGQSQDGPWTTDLVLEDIRCVIAHFGFKRVVLVGHSLGGVLATIYGARYSDCAAVVNLDGQTNAEREDSIHLYDGLDPVYVKAKLAEIKQLNAAPAVQPAPIERAQLEALIAATVAQLAPGGLDPQLIRDSAERPWVALPDGRLARRPAAATIADLLASIRKINLLEESRRCLSPLLIFNAARHVPAPEGLPVQGVDEMMRSFRRGFALALAQIARECPTVKVVDVDATHGMPVEIPAVLAGHIESFLASCKLA